MRKKFYVIIEIIYTKKSEVRKNGCTVNFLTKITGKTDRWICALLGLAALASRIPLRTHLLFTGDAGNYAMALERYSVSEYQPHPPGYILYILLGRVFNIVFHDANTALVAMSIVAGTISVMIVYLMACSIFNRNVGIAAGLLLLFSPLVWFYSEVALTYEVELLLALIATWLLFEMWFHRRLAITCAIFIGLAGGIKQDILMFLGPVWLLATLRVGPRRMILSWLSLSTAVLVWFTPLVYLSDGLASWWRLTITQFSASSESTAVYSVGEQAVTNSIHKVWEIVIWLLGAGVVGLAYWLVPLFRLRRPDPRLAFLALISLPSLLFFILVHFTQPGYLMICAGSLVLLAAKGIVRLADAGSSLIEIGAKRLSVLGKANRPLAKVLPLLVALLIAVTNAGLFLDAKRIHSQIPTLHNDFATTYAPWSLDGLHRSDSIKSIVLDVVHNYDPSHTLIFSVMPLDTVVYEARWLMYYLPEYRMITVEFPRDEYELALFNFENHTSRWIPGATKMDVNGSFDQALFIGISPNEIEVPVIEADDHKSKIPIYYAQIVPSEMLVIGPFEFSHINDNRSNNSSS